MSANEIVPTLGLALVILGLAGFFLFRQIIGFKAWRVDPALTEDDRRYLFSQGRRRIVCSLLMIVLAGFLVGWVFIAPNMMEAVPAAGADPNREAGKLPEGMRGLIYYWIIALVVLFVILALAALDLFATARYGLRNQKHLVDERRSLIEGEIERLKRIRRERNGHLGK